MNEKQLKLRLIWIRIAAMIILGIGLVKFRVVTDIVSGIFLALILLSFFFDKYLVRLARVTLKK